MSAHQTRNMIGQTVFSNRPRLILQDSRANRLVDVLAKKPAAFHQLTKQAADTTASATKLAQLSLAQLASVTHSANRLEVTSVDEHGVETKRIARDSMDKPKFQRSECKKRKLSRLQPKPKDISSVKPWPPCAYFGRFGKATQGAAQRNSQRGTSQVRQLQPRA